VTSQHGRHRTPDQGDRPTCRWQRLLLPEPGERVFNHSRRYVEHQHPLLFQATSQVDRCLLQDPQAHCPTRNSPPNFEAPPHPLRNRQATQTMDTLAMERDCPKHPWTRSRKYVQIRFEMRRRTLIAHYRIANPPENEYVARRTEATIPEHRADPIANVTQRSERRQETEWRDGPRHKRGQGRQEVSAHIRSRERMECHMATCQGLARISY